MVAGAVQSFLNESLPSSLSLREERINCLEGNRGARIDALNTTVVCAPTNTIQKDIFAGRFGLIKTDNYAYILPPSLIINGKSFAGLEFPIYYRIFFQQGKPLDVICTESQKEAMTKFLSRTIEGPNWRDPSVYPFVSKKDREFLQNIKDYHSPKDAEGKNLPLSSYVKFHTFDKNGKAILDKGGLRVDQARDEEGEIVGYHVMHDRTDIGKPTTHESSIVLSYKVPEPPLKEITFEAKEALEKNRFGFAVTCFGNSTGFDPGGYNTSFLAMMGGTGVLIDPSEEALEALDTLGLSDSDVPHVLLTHCHQDHDEGTLHRILEGKRINLIASRVVYEEFMTKAENLLKCQEPPLDLDPRKLVNWTELNVGKPTYLELPNGKTAKLEAWWNIHTIPTNGFSIEYDGKTYGHSGDTQWGDEFLDRLVENGVITQERADEHKNRWFTEDGVPKFDLINFEAGGPPIHTNESDIAKKVRAEFRDQVKLYHASDGLVKDSELHKVGLYETQVISPPDSEGKERERHYREIVESYPYFKDLDTLRDVWGHGEIKTYAPGEELISPEGGPIRKMRIIVSGTSIISRNDDVIAIRGAGSALGDFSHLLGVVPTATVTAKTKLSCFEIDIEDVATVDEIETLSIKARFARDSLPAFEESFAKMGISLSDSPRILLEMFGSVETFNLSKNEKLIRKGASADRVYFVTQGALMAYEDIQSGELVFPQDLGTIEDGQIFGERAIESGGVRSASVRALQDNTQVLSIDGKIFGELLNKYPGMMNAFQLQVKDRKNIKLPKLN